MSKDKTVTRSCDVYRSHGLQEQRSWIQPQLFKEGNLICRINFDLFLVILYVLFIWNRYSISLSYFQFAFQVSPIFSNVCLKIRSQG